MAATSSAIHARDILQDLETLFDLGRVAPGDADLIYTRSLLTNPNKVGNPGKSMLLRIVKLACQHRRPDLLECLIAGNIIVAKEGVEEEGKDMILCELTRPNENVLEMLIKRGCDVNASDKDGSVLMYCSRLECDKVLESLMDNGANVTACDHSYRQNALHQACLHTGGYLSAKLLIERGACVNARDMCDETPLMMAAVHGSTETVKLLISHGANVNARHIGGRSALVYSGVYGRNAVSEFLLENGARMDAVCEDGISALMYACQKGSDSFLKFLLKHKADVNARDCKNKTPLMYACTEKSWKVMELLLKHGAHVNARDEDGMTALMHASWLRCTQAIEVLIQYGADPNARNKAGKTALIIACEYGGRNIIIPLLCKHGADVHVKDRKGKTAFMQVRLCEEAIQALLEAGVIADTRRSKQRTLFMTACMCRNKKIMELLMNYDIDINAQDEAGETPLMLACQNDFPDIVEFLLHQGANINMQNNNGRTAAMIAAYPRRSKCLETLMAARTDVFLVDRKKRNVFSHVLDSYYRHEYDSIRNILRHRFDWLNGGCSGIDSNTNHMVGSVFPKILTTIVHGRSVRHMLLVDACMNRKELTINMLLRWIIDVNITDNRGMTPLHVMCEYGSIVGVKTLLRLGADVNVQSNNGTTAIMIAVIKNHGKCVERLLTAGADLDLMDKRRRTVFTYFLKFPTEGNTKILKRLLMENGKLMIDGQLKAIHQNNLNKCCFYHIALVAIEFGIFEWRWCQIGHLQDLKFLTYFALSAGFCPGQMKCGNLIASPLILSLILDDKKATKAFLQHKYYFPEDYRRLLTDNKLRARMGNSAFLEEIIQKPMSLQTWSFLTVSKAISLSGPPGLRSQRVESLPFPNKIKTMLSFK